MQLVNSLWAKCKYSLHCTITGVRHCYLVELSKASKTLLQNFPGPILGTGSFQVRWEGTLSLTSDVLCVTVKWQIIFNDSFLAL
jgi:hypothetical protein